jgi:UDP-glucose:(heptosyl)LPS alpha-1,3-glucosyltransferase
VTIGFDKTFGQDVLYPQGGLHAASVAHNRNKFARPLWRGLARVAKWFDLAHWSFSLLERRQYLKPAGESASLRGARPQIIVNSFMVRRHFEKYLGIPEGAVRVVRSAIDPDRFPEHDRPRRRAEWRERWGLSPRETVGLVAAMNYRLKGLEPLLHAVQRLFARSEYRETPPDFRLLVAGSPHTQPWERLAARLGIRDRVVFAGHCPEMRNAYFAADFLVHPTFYDPCSLVVLEALACALPVITTRANGASELLHPAIEGYVVADPHEHELLAECMVALLHPARRAACAQAARRTAAAWTFEHHYRELLHIFAEIVASKRAA